MFSDLRIALRQIVRRPGFAIAVIGLLGGALGVVLTIGSAAFALLWQPLPYPQGERLVLVRGHSPTMSYDFGFASDLADDLRRLDGFEAVGEYDNAKQLQDSSGGSFSSVPVSPELLAILGAQPLLGRLLTAEDADGVLLSESAWRARYGADPLLIGKMLDFDDTRLRVVGVVADRFRFPSRQTSLWTLLPSRHGVAMKDGTIEFGNVRVVARLSPGMSPQAADAAVKSRFDAVPEIQFLRDFAKLELQAVSLREHWTGERRPILLMLTIAASLLLLLLAANLAALWMSRALRRTREFALRSALGASGLRIGRMLAAEIVLLCAASVLLGGALVGPGIGLLERLGIVDLALPLAPAAGMPTLILGGLLFAMLSAAFIVIVGRLLDRGSLVQLAHASAGIGGSRQGERTQRALVVTQLALAIALLAGGGFLGRSLLNLLQQDIGFDPRHVVVVGVDTSNDAAGAAKFAALLEDVAAVPGVDAASLANAAPFTDSNSLWGIELRGIDAELSARSNLVSLDYLRVIGQPIVHGRGFEARDLALGEAAGVLVDELFVSRHFPDTDPLSAEIGLPDSKRGTQWRPIIGVVSTVRGQALDKTADQPTFYQLATAPAGGSFTMLFRSERSVDDIAPRLHELAEAHGVELGRLASLQQRVRDSVSDRVPLVVLVLAFTACGVILAALGLFALVAHAVQSRLGEFGLRLALGASGAQVRRLALRDGLRTAVPGLVLGLFAALGLGQLLASRLYQMTPWDAPTLLLSALLGIVLTLAACALPARRAARADPIIALRHE